MEFVHGELYQSTLVSRVTSVSKDTTAKQSTVLRQVIMELLDSYRPARDYRGR